MSELSFSELTEVNVFYLDHDPSVAARSHCDRHVVKMILETAQLLSTAWHVLAPEAIETDTACTDPAYPFPSLKNGDAAAARVLTAPFNYLGNQRIYGRTHEHHPSAVWVRESTGNYDWLWRLGAALLDEYGFRYRRAHASRHVLRTLERHPAALPLGAQTEPPTAMPDEYVALDAEGYADAVASYRAYYLGAKRPLLTYTRRPPPGWARELAVFKE